MKAGLGLTNILPETPGGRGGFAAGLRGMDAQAPPEAVRNSDGWGAIRRTRCARRAPRGAERP